MSKKKKTKEEEKEKEEEAEEEEEKEREERKKRNSDGSSTSARHASLRRQKRQCKYSVTEQCQPCQRVAGTVVPAPSLRSPPVARPRAATLISAFLSLSAGRWRRWKQLHSGRDVTR